MSVCLSRVVYFLYLVASLAGWLGSQVMCACVVRRETWFFVRRRRRRIDLATRLFAGGW